MTTQNKLLIVLSVLTTWLLLDIGIAAEPNAQRSRDFWAAQDANMEFFGECL
jgi:hypothetical protein